MRDGAAVKDVPQLVSPARPGLADDVDGVRGDSAVLRPVEQEARNGVVKELVRWSRRPQQVVVDPAERHRVEDRLGRRGVRPRPPCHEESSLRMWVQLANLLEQLATGRPRQPLRGEDQRDLFARIRKLRQLLNCLARRACADNPVAARVTVAQLAFDVGECGGIFFDGKNYRIRHQKPLRVVPSEAMSRIRMLVVLAFVLLIAAPAAAASRKKQFYVSLGDSYSTGHQPTGTGIGGSTRNGFADQLVTIARSRGYRLKLVNFGCGGETTTSILARKSACPLPAVGGPNYTGRTQAAAAARFLRRHRGEVALITVSIGGNDVMVVGSRKPFLNSSKDAARIQRYVDEFQNLQEQAAAELARVAK
jgi:lysophospholipase L1-like esterase